MTKNRRPGIRGKPLQFPNANAKASYTLDAAELEASNLPTAPPTAPKRE